ncbi:MAG: hypothetical protein HOY79_01795 [Streptomyces sp.]|nr:hypothetical protein [Streptomyces sp.]
MNLRVIIRLAATVAVGLVVCGGLGTLAGVLASLPFHGLAHTVVWAVVGSAVAVTVGVVAEKTADRRGWL